MLLVFRTFRNHLENSHFYEFVDKTNRNEILNYLKKLTYTSHSTLPTNWTLAITKNLLTFLCTRYKIRSTSLIENYRKIDETSVTYSMEKSITKRRRRRTNARRKIIVNIKKKKRSKMQNFWLNYQAVQQLPHLNGVNLVSQTENLQGLSFTTTEANSYSDVLKSCSLLHSKGTNLNQFLAEVRYDLYTPYGQRLKDSWSDDRAKNGCLFKVLSYNILAPGLLEMHPSLYRDHDQRYLGWEDRKIRIIKEIKNFNADILCLQEVQMDKLDFFNSEMHNLGYIGVFKKRTSDKIDGCAIYYRPDKFVLREQATVEYNQPNIWLLDRDNIALIVRFSPKNQPDRSIVVANTHLLFNPNRQDIKLAQVQMLLAEIDRIAYKRFDGERGTIYHPIILSGDLNIRPFSHVYHLLSEGYVDNIASTFRSRRQNYSTPHLLIPERLGVTDGCQHYDVILHRTPVRSEISDFRYVRLHNSDRKSLSAAHEHNTSRRNHMDPELFGSGCLYHNLRLNSVYPHNRSQNATTYQNSWINVDYIFYGPCETENGEKIDGELKLVSYLKCPDKFQAEYLHSIPNVVCGSDHLPLVASFHLPSDV